MKANELRIGNWVNSKKFNVPVILGLEDFGEAYAYADGANSLEWFETHLLPIPLTEEWLLRFGFEKKQFGEFKKGIYWFGIVEPENGFQLGIGRSTPLWQIVEIKHVHQLQNLFYSLTGKELKEEKEEQPTKGI